MAHLTRRGLMWSVAATGLLGARHAGAGASTPRKLIYVLADGGWDVTYCFDEKLGVPTVEGPELDPFGAQEAVQTFDGIPIVVNETTRPSVSRFFQNWAAESAVVNGIHVGTIGHTSSRFRILTGSSGQRPGPDVATICGATWGSELPVGSVALSGLGIGAELSVSRVHVGARGQLLAVLDPDHPFPPSAFGTAPLTYGDVDLAQIDQWQASRRRALEARFGGTDRNDQRIEALAESTLRASRLRDQRQSLLDAIPIGAPSDFAQNAAVAVDLLASGQCHTVFMDTGHNWDTHGNNVDQHVMFEETFAVLDALAADLHARGMLEEVLVVVVSEMTRTPRVNIQRGKDHWPYTSALLFGGGTVGGQTLGGTDDNIEPLPVDLQTGQLDPGGEPLTFDSFAAGLLSRLDVDPTPWVGKAPIWRGGTV